MFEMQELMVVITRAANPDANRGSPGRGRPGSEHDDATIRPELPPDDDGDCGDSDCGLSECGLSECGDSDCLLDSACIAATEACPTDSGCPGDSTCPAGQSLCQPGQSDCPPESSCPPGSSCQLGESTCPPGHSYCPPPTCWPESCPAPVSSCPVESVCTNHSLCRPESFCQGESACPADTGCGPSLCEADTNRQQPACGDSSEQVQSESESAFDLGELKASLLRQLTTLADRGHSSS